LDGRLGIGRPSHAGDAVPFVYAIGDVVAIPLTLDKPLPKAGVFAHGEAEIVAKNIAHGITGRGDGAASVAACRTTRPGR
jgi:NADH dehydrogenase FAD-containing subunit